jgi:hypothetical protein
MNKCSCKKRTFIWMDYGYGPFGFGTYHYCSVCNQAKFFLRDIIRGKRTVK